MATITERAKMILGIRPDDTEYPDVPPALEALVEDKLDKIGLLVNKIVELTENPEVTALDTIRLDSSKGRKEVERQGRTLINGLSLITGYPIKHNPFGEPIKLSYYRPN